MISAKQNMLVTLRPCGRSTPYQALARNPLHITIDDWQ
jgi:hypothetical protein